MANAPSPLEIPGRKGALLVLLFMSLMAILCFVGALVLGTEPRIDLVRTAERTFQATGTNSFSGVTFFRKSIQGVTGVIQGNAYRDRVSDSRIEKKKQRKRKHLAFAGDNGSILRWDRETDQVAIEEFMRGSEPSLILRAPAPLWRKAIAWFLAGFGVLVFMGGVGAFFPKRKDDTRTS